MLGAFVANECLMELYWPHTEPCLSDLSTITHVVRKHVAQACQFWLDMPMSYSQFPVYSGSFSPGPNTYRNNSIVIWEGFGRIHCSHVF